MSLEDNPTFDEAKKDAALFALLKTFMIKKVLVEENYEFLTTSMNNQAKFARFIPEGSPMQINIDAPRRLALEGLASNGQWAQMDGPMNAARTEIMSLTNADTLPKFMKSQEYQAYKASKAPKTASKPVPTPPKPTPATKPPPPPPKQTASQVKPPPPPPPKKAPPPPPPKQAPQPTAKWQPAKPTALSKPNAPATKPTPPAPPPPPKPEASKPAPGAAPVMSAAVKSALTPMDKDLTEGTKFFTTAKATVKSKGVPKDKDAVNDMFNSGRMRHDKVHNPFTALLQKDKTFTRENYEEWFTRKDAFSKLWAEYKKLLGK